MSPHDRQRLAALRRGAEGADPHGNVALRTDDLLFLLALALAAAPPEPSPPSDTPQ